MNVAFIPVRGGSKSIPLKNIKEICGRPLVYWVISAACECCHIDRVYVATDSDAIRDTVKNFGDIKNFDKVEVIGRSEESASDTASTESAMLEFSRNYSFDNIVLIQATSPLLQAEDLERGFETFAEDGVDSVLSAVLQKRFIWANKSDGFSIATNYDYFNRPRRQDFEGYYVENGAFYITSKKNLEQSQNRISGNIKIVEMREESFFEIDEPSDWIVIEALMKKIKRDLPNNKSKIKMLLTDCDGCLTDGGMYYSEKGDELKKFNTKDGMGFQLLRENSIRVGIITGESVELNKRRAQKLHLDILEEGCKNKKEVIEKLALEYDIPLENICYIGDDINDLEAMKLVGLSGCPLDASEEIKQVADVIAPVEGGNGVIRYVADYIMRKDS